MTIRFDGGFMAPSCFLEQTSHIQIEVAYFLLLACPLNYHGMND